MAAASQKSITNDKQMYVTSGGSFTKAESKALVMSDRAARTLKTAMATTHKGPLTVVDAPAVAIAKSAKPAKVATAAAKPSKGKTEKPSKGKPADAKPKTKAKKPKASATV